jgi:hypothetical protein
MKWITIEVETIKLLLGFRVKFCGKCKIYGVVLVSFIVSEIINA